MQQKRLFLALALSMLVVLAFTYFQNPETESDKPKHKNHVKKTASRKSSNPSVRQSKDQTPDEKKGTITTGFDTDRFSVKPRHNNVEGTIPFRTNKFKGHFSLAGASLESVKLLDYSRLDNPKRKVDLVKKKSHGLMTLLADSTPVLKSTRFHLVESTDPNVYQFRTNLKTLSIRKTYRFDTDTPYRAQLSVSLRNRSSKPLNLDDLRLKNSKTKGQSLGLRWGPGFGEGRKRKTQFGKVYVHYAKNGEAEYLSPQGAGGLYSLLPFFGKNKGDTGNALIDGPVEWSAVSNRYFVVGISPHDSFDRLFLDTEKSGENFVAWFTRNPMTLEPGETKKMTFDLYLGPKFYGKLQAFQDGMESTLNYGWFTVLSYPILLGLRWIYAVIPNYGLAIIILSIVIKFLLYPLTKKGLTNMQKMKKLQPKMKEIQEEYSDDKEKLNEKLMEFYQEHNVNPMGGCLPMLLQLPILIALYRMLEYSIELRGAPFAFWITDLSAPDPYYMLPVIMGVVMFLQQSYSMSSMAGSGGSQQQIMKYVMPVFLVFLFMRFPVGLVIYYTMRSGITLLQYWMINRSMDLESLP